MKKSKTFLLVLLFLMGQILVFSQSDNHHLFIGTYTNTGSYGIYVYQFNTNTGNAVLLDSAKNDNPSYLAINKKGNRLYAVDENAGTNPGAISAFSFNKKTHTFQFLNHQPTGGDHPCFVAIDKKGSTVLAANYTGGSLSVFHANKNGSLQPVSQIIQHYGKSVNKQRQEKPHVHQTMFSPDGKYVFANDLGLDETAIYPIIKKGKYETLDTIHKITVKASASAGPRHTAFHPTLPVYYVVGEMAGTVSAFKWVDKTPTLLQTISIDTIDAGPDKGSADIHVSPDGKFVYVSNRGKSNNLAICQVDATTGILKTIGYQSTLGIQPRNFVIDPTGNYLLVAHQTSNTIIIFKRDMETGLLTPTGKQLLEKAPTCLIFD